MKINNDVKTTTARGPILNPGRSSSKYRIRPAPVEGIGAVSFLLFCLRKDIL
jgi:hypothetical protein